MKKYDLPMDASTESIPGKFIKQIEKGSTVLEFGCAYGRMTKYMQEQLHCNVSVVELDPEAFQIARSYAVDGFCGDIDQDEWFYYFSGRQFDCIMFADVLEHLRDPLQALIRAKSLLTEDGKIIISLPNIGHNDILVKLFQNRFDYTSIGLLDNTHIHFWGYENLEQFATQAGLGIRQLDGADQPPLHTEQKPDANTIPSELSDILACRRFNEVYQFFLVLQKREWMDQNGLSTENNLNETYNALNIYCYWDLGTGYQAHQHTRIIPHFTPTGVVQFRCDTIPANCQKVRFDPPLGYYCLISDIHVMTNVSSCTIYPLNGVTVNGVNVFSNTNPQMEFALPEGAQWFEITARLHICSSREFGEIFSALQTLPSYQATQQDLVAARDQALKELATLQVQAKQELEAAQIKAKQECEEVQRKGQAILTAKNDQLEEELARREVFQQQISFLHEYSTSLKLQVEQSAPQATANATSLDHINQLQQTVANLHSDRAALEAQYLAVINSTCWKITRPLRSFLTAIRKAKTHQATTYIPSTSTENCEFSPNGLPYVLPTARKTLSAMGEKVKSLGGQVIHEERFFYSEIATQKKLLLVSHELSLTGAPVALQHFGEAAQQMGYFPVFIAPCFGALCDQLDAEDFPIMLLNTLFSSDLVREFADAFDAIVVCTNVGAPIVASLNGSQTPVLWWIHEARISYHADVLRTMPDTLASNIHVYCGGRYAEKILREFRPNYFVNQLLYFVPDYSASLPETPTFQLKYAQGKTVFAIVGTQEERKGQDILVQAIRSLDHETRKKCLFVFVGRAYYIPILEEIFAAAIDFPRNVMFIQELNRDDLNSLYLQTDCLICTSRDDPMPIVVTEAMLMSKAIICSENSGSAPLLEEADAGLIYHNNDPAELTRCIEYVCANKGHVLTSMGQRARSVYEQFFTPAVFEQSVHTILEQITTSDVHRLLPFDGTVSVVIPTYNAGEDLVALVQSLHTQQLIGTLEIIVVDSESQDGTAEHAEQLDAKVIRIHQAEFSHSYARNLGAQHACGKYLLFMTQDAKPSDSLWISRLLQPILNDGVVAVSCRESPKADCDLLGRISIWIHSEYMGILESDRLMRLPAQQDYDSLRRNSQLNDVACLIDRDLFMRFQYQGNYAEDLDLGLRLIQAGHTLALLATAPVIHSHTRPAFYHMKRALVDLRTLKTVLPQMPTETINAQTVANRAISSYCALALFLQRAALRPSEESWSAFYQWCTDCYSRIKQELFYQKRNGIKRLIQEGKEYFGEQIWNFADTLLQDYQEDFCLDLMLAESWFFFLTHEIPRYYAAQNIHFDLKARQDVLDLMPKYTAQLFGILLAYYDLSHPMEDNIVRRMITEYSKGV